MPYIWKVQLENEKLFNIFFFAVKEMQLNSVGVPSVRMAIIKTRGNNKPEKGIWKMNS